MTKEYIYDRESYMHKYSQYFAIEFAKLFNCKICLWLEEDKIEGKEILCHAFAKIANNLYVDAYGVFTHISERYDDVKHKSVKIVEHTIEETKIRLKMAGVAITKPNIKRNVREYLRNNILLFNININNMNYTVGYYGKSKVANTDNVMLRVYNTKNDTFSEYITQINMCSFLQTIKKSLGFCYDEKWYYKK